MKLTHLRDVAAVAERGSLRAAARHLGLAQPAISRSIRELEHELGVPLFERRARGVVLTPMGAVFLKRITSIHHDLRQAVDEIEQLKGQAVGQVTMALSTVPHIALLPKALQAFYGKFSDVRVKIIEGLFPAAEAGLRDGGVDFYVGPLTETPPTSEFSVERLFENRRVVLGRKGHPLAGARSLADLGQARWISTSVMSRSAAELGPVFVEQGLPPPEVVVEAASALTMMITAANTDFLMMLPEQWLEFPSTRQLLDPIMLEQPIAAPAICIVHRSKLPLTPAAEYMADMFRRSAEHYVTARAKAQRV